MLGGLEDEQGVSALWFLKGPPAIHSAVHFLFSVATFQFCGGFSSCNILAR